MGPGTWSQTGNCGRDSEYMPRKFLWNRRMITSQLSVFFMIIYMLEFLTITGQSSLIVVALGREWVQAQRLPPVDMILTSLGICRFFQLWSSMLYNFGSHFCSNYNFWYFGIVWEFTNILSFWLTSLLAVFYCVKISFFSHPIFLWLKWRIVRLVPRLLLGSLLISCVSIIFSTTSYYINIQFISMKHFPRNSTMLERLEAFLWDFSTLQKVAVLVIPFLLFLASTILLMALLSWHLKQLKDLHTGRSNSSLEAHSAALRSLAIFLTLFTFYFLTVLLSILDVLFNKESWFWAWEAIIYALVSIHSTLLMLSSAKLKRVLKARCWSLEASWGTGDKTSGQMSFCTDTTNTNNKTGRISTIPRVTMGNHKPQPHSLCPQPPISKQTGSSVPCHYFLLRSTIPRLVQTLSWLPLPLYPWDLSPGIFNTRDRKSWYPHFVFIWPSLWLPILCILIWVSSL